MASNLRIRENISLKESNTLGVPSITRWYCEATSLEEVSQVIDFINKNNCPLLVVGGGSNLILPDFFEGLTLKLVIKGFEVIREDEDHVQLALGAGENWHDLVMATVQRGWYGLQNMALIPGTVGAAPIQNIGAYGEELMNCFEYLEAVNISTGKLLKLTKEECQFSYRHSIFKSDLKDQVIIVRVVINLHKKGDLSLSYPALKNYFNLHSSTQVNLKNVAQAVIDIRQSKLPNPDDIPNAGSFFKNPIISKEKYEVLKALHPEMPVYPFMNQFKVAAGWLIEQTGWKGKWHKNIRMHVEQALVLTNPNACSSRELLEFANDLVNSVKDKFDIPLEIEPQIIHGTHRHQV